jgi:hypothetical protein
VTALALHDRNAERAKELDGTRSAERYAVDGRHERQGDAAVTTPRTTQAVKVDRVNAARLGRTTISSITPAHTSRSHAAPAAPIWSINPTDIARPNWTLTIEAVAINAPLRASPKFDVTTALNVTEPFASTC